MALTFNFTRIFEPGRIDKVYRILSIFCCLVLSTALFSQESFDLLKKLDAGLPSSDYFGYSISSAGDLNKDGYKDIIIGSPYNDLAAQDAGCAYVYFGGAVINDKADLTLPGQNENGNFGESVSFAGDVNGDGYSDIIVGGFYTGKAKIYFGGEEMDTLPDLTFRAQNASSNFGNSVSTAGDFNKDGFDDVIIGDFCNSKNGTQSGRAFVYYGGKNMDTNPDLEFDGEAEFNQFGGNVAYAGDLNMDGFSDIMIGAPGFDINELLGRLYIYFGAEVHNSSPDLIINGTHHYRKLGGCMALAGDINNDGYDDIIVGEPYEGDWNEAPNYASIYYGGAIMDTVPDVSFENSYYGFGKAVSRTGDLNNDGFSDVMISSMENVYFYFGGIEMDTVPDIIIKNDGDLWDEFGSSLSFTGDLNKDGYTDILIGEPNTISSGSQMGSVYIYSNKIKNSGINPEKGFSQNQVYPNPFTTETTIKYFLQKPGKITIKIFNASGQELKTLVNGPQTAGEHHISLQADNLPAGLYLCKIQSEEFSETKKLVLQK